MNIGPQQIVQLIQVNEKLKEKVQALEQDRLRFISVMAEVKLSHQQELETLAKKLAEQNLLKVLFGQLGGQPSSNEEKPEQLEKSEQIDQSQMRVSAELGQSGQSIGSENQKQLATEMQRLMDQKRQDDATMKEMNQRLNRAISDLKHANEWSEELEREVNRLKELLEQKSHLVEPISETQLLSSDLEMIVERKEKQQEESGIKRQDSDLQEKSDLQDQLTKLLNKERQLQLELGTQLRQISSLEEFIKSTRLQKDAEILNLRNQLEDAEQRYSRQITSIRQAMESSRHERTHQSEQIRRLIHTEENRETNIKHHLRQVFENRKEKINLNKRENTYEDLANLLCQVVRNLERQYQPPSISVSAVSNPK